MPILDIIVTHYNEPWNVGKKFFDMLAMQRTVDFSSIRVILVQDGKEDGFAWGQLMNGYPYQIKVVSIDHAGPAAARNAGLKIATADWVMFCDFDDMFSDVASLCAIMQVLPTDDADIIWMKSYREERVRATKQDIKGVFLNCLSENFQYTFGKMYRRSALYEHNIQFNTNLPYEYENAFNHLALTVIPPFRVLQLTVGFIPYVKTLRKDSYTTNPHTVNERINAMYWRDVYLTNEYRSRGLQNAYKDMVAETVFDMYYMLNTKPAIRALRPLTISFTRYYEENCEAFWQMNPSNLEVIMDNCINKMLGTVQNLYNYNSIEAEPPFDGLEKVQAWLNDLDVDTDHDPQPVQAGKYTGPRVVIYCGTYNTYLNMLTSAKSLLSHTQVDKIYFLTEDDVFPYEIPDIIENINVKNQEIFPADGPNYNNVWSYMCMMRAAFPSMFPQYTRALSLDIDIIVNEDIGQLWDLDLTDYYFAGVPEPCRQKTSEDPVYCNFGVIMMNLEKIRNDEKDLEVMKMLNTSRLGCPEQDAFNKVCAHHILALPPDYNYTPFSHITGEPEHEIITHYAGLKYWKHFRPVREYAGKEWNEIMNRRIQE